MLTPAEYLKDKFPKNHTLWLDGMDIIKHCLKKDLKKTFYKDQNPSGNTWNEFNEAMQDRVQSNDNFQEIYDNAYQPKPKPIVIQDDSGILDVSAFIAKEELCFESEITLLGNTEAVSVLIDLGVPFADRKKTYMLTRHQKVYDLIAQCDGENRPIQVIAAFSLKIAELTRPLKCFIVIKDYSDTIFPTIWGCLKNNKVANSFLNVVIDYFIGTKTYDNGTIENIDNVEQYFADHENLIIFGNSLKSYNATYIND